MLRVAPKVLVTTDRYYYRGRRHAMAPKLAAIAPRLPSVARTLVFDYLPSDGGADGGGGAAAALAGVPTSLGAVWADDFVGAARAADPPPLASLYAPLPFDAPVYVMFSSGTTGRPKCMVQGVGVTLNHVKELGLHMDIAAADRVLWFTTTGWMMWK